MGKLRGVVLLSTLCVVATLASACTDDAAKDALPSLSGPSAALPSPSAPSGDPSSSASPSPSDATAQPTSQPSSGSGIDGARAIITIATLDADSGLVLVGGYVSGVVEDGGTCTFAVRNASGKPSASQTSTGVDNVSSTSCGSVSFDAAAVPNGTYTVTLGYSNAQGSVTSDPVELEVSR